MLKLIFLLITLVASITSAPKGNAMPSILIVYGSYQGSTAEVATKIKETLDNLNCTTTIMPASAVQVDLTKYDLIVIGSAIHGNRPHENIVKFIELNRPALSGKKIAIFAICATITSTIPKRKANALTYPEKIANGLKLVDKAIFGGIIGQSGWFGNFMGKKILGVIPGDYRNWDEIKAWATGLTLHLLDH
jgi:menaquinone-dependent protoporphyrinogen oxidase